MGDQVLVETHLRWCHTCAARLEDAQIIGASLRLSARAQYEAVAQRDGDGMPPAPRDGAHDDDITRALTAMQAEVLARIDMEYEQSLAVRTRELFTDMRLLWPALGATVAVALSVGLASGVWRATSTEQPASLAAIIENLADPGSNRNPQRLDAAMYLPRVLDDGTALDGMMLADANAPYDDEVAVAAILTREGKIGGYALLDESGRHMLGSGASNVNDVRSVLQAVSRSRFAPAARPGGQIVAVNMVWLFARTTVKPSDATVDLGTPLPRPVVALPRPAAAAAKPPAGVPVIPAETGASTQDSPEKPPAPPLESATA